MVDDLPVVDTPATSIANEVLLSALAEEILEPSYDCNTITELTGFIQCPKAHILINQFLVTADTIDWFVECSGQIKEVKDIYTFRPMWADMNALQTLASNTHVRHIEFKNLSEAQLLNSRDSIRMIYDHRVYNIFELMLSSDKQYAYIRYGIWDYIHNYTQAKVLLDDPLLGWRTIYRAPCRAGFSDL